MATQISLVGVYSGDAFFPPPICDETTRVWDLKLHVARTLPDLVLEGGVDQGIIIFREDGHDDFDVCDWRDLVDPELEYRYGLHKREHLQRLTVNKI